MELKLELSASSIDKALKAVKEYQGKLENGFCEELEMQLAGEGAAFARTATPDSNLGVRIDRDADGCKVVAYGYEWVSPNGWPYYISPALYEFGTGTTGAGTYPGDVPTGYVYGAGTPEHQRAHTKTGWFYYDEALDKQFTRGEAAQPYMLNAAMHMRSKVAEVAREVLKYG